MLSFTTQNFIEYAPKHLEGLSPPTLVLQCDGFTGSQGSQWITFSSTEPKTIHLQAFPVSKGLRANGRTTTTISSLRKTHAVPRTTKDMCEEEAAAIEGEDSKQEEEEAMYKPRVEQDRLFLLSQRACRLLTRSYFQAIRAAFLRANTRSVNIGFQRMRKTLNTPSFQV